MAKEPWNGLYETSEEGQQSLEQDILDAGMGKFVHPTGDGQGTVKEYPTSINVYGPDPSSPKGHWHKGVNTKGQKW